MELTPDDKYSGVIKKTGTMSPLKVVKSIKIVLPPGSNEVGVILGVLSLGKRFVVGVGTN